MRDHYEVLGAPPTATSAELRRAYREAARRTHPDAGGREADFRDVQQAWDVLGDADRRVAYDHWLLGSGPPRSQATPAPPVTPSPASTAAPPASPAPPEEPWRRPSVGLLPTRSTVLGPVLLSAAMLLSVLTMLSPWLAVLVGLGVVGTVWRLLRGRGVAVSLAAAGLLVLGLGAAAALAPSSGQSAMLLGVAALCAAVMAAAVGAAAFVRGERPQA